LYYIVLYIVLHCIVYCITLYCIEIPTLPPLDTPEEEDELEDEEDGEPLQKPPKPDDKIRKHTSGPKVQNPYAVSDSTSYIIPIFAAVAAFVPLLYCLCKI